jgi:hypothetical protein
MGAKTWMIVYSDGDAKERLAKLPAIDREATAKLAAELFPALTNEVLAVINRFLPSPGGIGRRTAFGYESQSSASPSMLTAMNEQAAAANNQLRPRPEWPREKQSCRSDAGPAADRQLAGPVPAEADTPISCAKSPGVSNCGSYFRQRAPRLAYP